ncbi:hypothetical protein B0H13DRAFT_1982964, partial [Mycena leptocephala]
MLQRSFIHHPCSRARNSTPQNRCKRRTTRTWVHSTDATVRLPVSTSTRPALGPYLPTPASACVDDMNRVFPDPHRVHGVPVASPYRRPRGLQTVHRRTRVIQIRSPGRASAVSAVHGFPLPALDMARLGARAVAALATSPPDVWADLGQRAMRYRRYAQVRPHRTCS